MKKLTVFLCVSALWFGLAGRANSATVNCIMYSGENDEISEIGPAAPPITSDYYFTIEVDDSNNVISFTDLLGSYWLSHEYGGWNTEDNQPFEGGEQIFKTGVAYDLSTILWDGVATAEAGHGLWFRLQSDPMGVFGGTVFIWGIFSMNFDGTDGSVLTGPVPGLAEPYVFHAIPIPSAIWLLGSGLIGFIGFRRKFKKR